MCFWAVYASICTKIMQTEIEAKFTDINMDGMRARLKELGAKLVYPERLMKRINYDYKSGGNAWVRVRDEGDKITMTFKRILDRSLHGTQEVNLVVDDFQRAGEFLDAIGMTGKSLQETKREQWILDECEVTLDTWPWVPSFLEVEGPSEAAVRSAAAKLGMDWSHAMHGSVETVYQQHYDVTEEEIDAWPSITFIPVPDWLEAKRKKASA